MSQHLVILSLPNSRTQLARLCSGSPSQDHGGTQSQSAEKTRRSNNFNADRWTEEEEIELVEAWEQNRKSVNRLTWEQFHQERYSATSRSISAIIQRYNNKKTDNPIDEMEKSSSYKTTPPKRHSRRMTKTTRKRKADELVDVPDDGLDNITVDSSPDDPVEQINGNGEYEPQISSRSIKRPNLGPVKDRIVPIINNLKNMQLRKDTSVDVSETCDSESNVPIPPPKSNSQVAGELVNQSVPTVVETTTPADTSPQREVLAKTGSVSSNLSNMSDMHSPVEAAPAPAPPAPPDWQGYRLNQLITSTSLTEISKISAFFLTGVNFSLLEAEVERVEKFKAGRPLARQALQQQIKVLQAIDSDWEREDQMVESFLNGVKTMQQTARPWCNTR